MPGKTTFFVANQANLEDVPAEKLKQLEADHKAIEETNKGLSAELKAANSGALSAAYSRASLTTRQNLRS